MLRKAYRLACCVNSRAPSHNPLDRIHGAPLSCPSKDYFGFFRLRAPPDNSASPAHRQSCRTPETAAVTIDSVLLRAQFLDALAYQRSIP